MPFNFEKVLEVFEAVSPDLNVTEIGIKDTCRLKNVWQFNNCLKGDV